jgi:periplasmic mercuric ion binding protein
MHPADMPIKEQDREAGVSFKDKTAVVTYDDSKADVTALTTATTNAGYPSTPRS